MPLQVTAPAVRLRFLRSLTPLLPLSPTLLQALAAAAHSAACMEAATASPAPTSAAANHVHADSPTAIAWAGAEGATAGIAPAAHAPGAGRGVSRAPDDLRSPAQACAGGQGFGSPTVAGPRVGATGAAEAAAVTPTFSGSSSGV